jgi:hypothetical protein
MIQEDIVRIAVGTVDYSVLVGIAVHKAVVDLRIGVAPSVGLAEDIRKSQIGQEILGKSVGYFLDDKGENS